MVQLKSELELRGLRTSGSKAELVGRLNQALTDAGFDPENFEFDPNAVEDETDVQGQDENTRGEGGADGDVIAAIHALAARQEAQIQQVMEQQDENFGQLAARLERNFHAKTKEIELRMNQMESQLYGEIEGLNQRLQNLRRNPNETVVASIPIGPKLVPPIFDGTSEFNVFKIQFLAIAEKNRWTDEDKAMVLLLSLKGNAANVLQSIPEVGQKDFATIMSALERRFSNEHSKQLLHIQLKSRVQKKDESIQEYSFDIERLVQAIFGSLPHHLLEMNKVQSFIDGIRDVEIKKQLMINQKITLAETLEYALLLESASVACGALSKVRCVEKKDESLAEVVCQAVKVALQPQKVSQPFKGRCYKCDQVGHMARDCRALKGRIQGQFRQKASGDEQIFDKEICLN